MYRNYGGFMRETYYEHNTNMGGYIFESIL